MVQCEMCGAETQAPKTIKVEGAKLDVCSNCTDFGTEVKTADSTSSTSTKYSTGSSGSSGSGSSASGSTGSGSGSSGGGATGGGGRSDMFDEMDEVAPDYDETIRRAREEAGLSQSELADELNEKASLIRKLERGETLPSDAVQSKLERFLDVSLTASTGGDEDAEWSGGSSSGSYTLGDVVERKD